MRVTDGSRETAPVGRGQELVRGVVDSQPRLVRKLKRAVSEHSNGLQVNGLAGGVSSLAAFVSTPTGDNSFDVSIAMDIDGIGVQGTRETTMRFAADFAGDTIAVVRGQA